MRRLTYQKTVNARRLHEELARLPKLAPVVDPLLLDPETGKPGGRRAVFSLAASATTVEVLVDEEVDERAISAVIDAHDGTPDPAPPRAKTARQILVEELDAATTVAQVKAAVRKWAAAGE